MKFGGIDKHHNKDKRLCRTGETKTFAEEAKERYDKRATKTTLIEKIEKSTSVYVLTSGKSEKQEAKTISKEPKKSR